MTQDGSLYKRSQRKLIAALLRSTGEHYEVFERIMPDDFDEPAFELIFGVMVELTRRESLRTPTEVAVELQARGQLDAVGGELQIWALYTEGGSALREGTPIAYARAIREAAAKRRLGKVFEDYGPQLNDNSGTTGASLISQVQSELSEQSLRLSSESNVYELSKLLDNYEETLEARAERKRLNAETAQGLQGIPCLIPGLDKLTSGWKESQMITIAAKTGVGKSVFAVMCALAAIQAGKSVKFFSLEMSEEEIADRMLSAASGILLNNIRDGELSDSDFDTFNRVRSELREQNLSLDVDSRQTIDSIRAKALKAAQEPRGLDLIIIDYLQLITPSGRAVDRQQQVSEISRELKVLAKQLQVPLIVLAQIKRDTKEEVPTSDEIRESGSIAQDSDVVVIIHRERAVDGELPPTSIILSKQRGGVSGRTIRCHSRLETSFFQEMSSIQDVENYSEEDMKKLEAQIASDGIVDFGEGDDDDEFDFDDEGLGDF